MSYNFKSVAVCLILLNEIISNFPLFLPKSSRSLKCDPEISDIWEFSHNLLEIDFQFNSIILRYDSLAHCIVYLCKYCVKDLKLKKKYHVLQIQSIIAGNISEIYVKKSNGSYSSRLLFGSIISFMSLKPHH